ncbi:hypothetical protein JCM33374_g5653 [Metschnikowia sp. JCM 33374]|nr:hypothetical protein JCM33374_g5653 [Metschnikowia sp. JCM 33374]
MNLVKEVPYNIRTRLETPYDVKNAVYITLIEAYHCLGASMFLIEELDASNTPKQGSRGHDSQGMGKVASEEPVTDTPDTDFHVSHVSRAVLCTGDLRAEHWWCEGLRASPALFPYIIGDRPLDCIYFDSTFAYRDEPYIEIPPNSQGIHEAVSMLRDYPRADPEIDFEFSDTTLGFEQAWSFALSYFGGSLKISNHHLAKKLILVSEHDRVNGKILRRGIENSSIKGKYPIFHAGTPENTNSIIVKIKQCINFNIRDYTGICCPISLDNIPSMGELLLLHTTKLGNKLYKFLGRHWILPVDGKELLPLEIKLLFSRHSSYSEVKAFLSMFKPRQVFPCFYSQKVWSNGFIMARVFGSICVGNVFNYDKMMASDYGRPSRAVLDRPVATINRWSIDECDKEQKFIEELMERKTLPCEEHQSDGPALIKLRKVVRVPFMKSKRNNEDWDFIKRRRRDFSAQKVSEGRRNVNYENFVKEQQMLYYKKHNLPQYKRDYHSPKYSREFTSALGGTSDYDTDSCNSSFDLLERSRKMASLSQSFQEASFVNESQQGLFWKVHNLSAKGHQRPQRSFLKSSFDSFEENRFPQTSEARSNSTLYQSEGRIDPGKIDQLSVSLVKTPHMWRDVQLRCTA